MIAEVKKVKEAEVEEVKLERTRDDHHPRDFEEARVECLSRGDDLSKNSTAQSVLKVCHEIEQGWNRFFETCDPESDYPDIEGLLMVLGKLFQLHNDCSEAVLTLLVLSSRGIGCRSASASFHFSDNRHRSTPRKA